ncbi:MAG: hypothetical protein AAFP86_03640 [Planctomycetota bacterium]
MNPPGTSYVDPELHPTEPEMVFQTPGGVWLGAIDRGTGLFVSADGLDRFVDVTTSLTVSKNGPEYGLDVGGTAVFYNRIGTSGQVEIWRATPGAAGFTTESLTAPDLDRINQLPSQDAAAPSTHLLYARIGGGAGIGSIARLDEDDPAGEALITPLLPGFAGFRWARGSTLYTSTIAAGPEAGEVVLGDARTGVERTVTGGQGLQFDPFAWFAPEFGGATCVISVTAGTDLAVWRDTGGATFDLHAMLPPPPGTSMRFVQSAEPFVADGRSFVSLTLKDHPGSIYTDVTESEIWIYGIDGGAERYVQRADDLGPGRIRHEAETFAGDGEVFLYYNELLPSGRFDLVRVRTGLRP